MKSFLFKFIICLLPCLLAGWITAVAVSRYIAGDPGGFKLGTDLVGGTILVYEIDLKKKIEGDKGDMGGKDNTTNLLAESLKRRIDPNDLYNIVIRPAGGEGRVEIILPTGGIYRTQKAEAAWEELLREMEKKFNIPTNTLAVGRGRSEELADRIQVLEAQSKWENTFKDPKAWERLIKHATSITDGWVELKSEVYDPKLAKLPVGQFQPLIEFLQEELRAVGTPNVTETAIKNWIKLEAWKEMLDQATVKWAFLKDHREDLFRIPPDNNEQFISFVNAKGNTYGQAVLNTLEPVLGNDLLTGKNFVPRKEAQKFVEDHYGPSLADIRKAILDVTEKTGRSRDLTVEEVQRIKELVAKVGSLEFRMLANSEDDKVGVDAAAAYINSIDKKSELEEYQKEGLPPPGPRDPNGALQRFAIKLSKDNKSTLTYSWVELGPQERRSLNLDNAAETELGRSFTWNDAKLKRGTASTLKDPSSQGKLLQGALFYSRECLNRNLPEEERRNKKIEYFVLARNPEIDPNDPTEERETPKIDGSFLVSATSGQGADLRPAVHFQFNTEGGRLFGNLTRKNVPSGTGDNSLRRHLAIILDGMVMSAPTINSEITTHGQISGSFTQKEVDALVNILRSGALPATLKPQPVSENTMGPTLGQDTIQSGVTAVFLAFLAVLAFMIVYYRFAGLVASIALLANLLLTVGFMVAVQATFTLPGLAGLVLMLGMAVDANVLIYERLREERERGASLALAIRNGYDRALPTIIDTHLSSIFTAIVLYIVGNDQLKGFGVSLTVGLIISLFTSLFMTRLMFDFWQAKGWLHKLSMLRLFAKPDIDFMGIRKPMFTATIVLALLGIGLFIGRLPNDLNIDFVGGTAYGGKLNRPVTVAELRGLFAEANQKAWLKVKAREEADATGTHYTLTYENPKDNTTETRSIFLINKPDGDTPEKRAQALEARANHLPDHSVEQVFLSEDFANAEKSSRPMESNASPNFTIRTSEKEPELVQVTIDRLLRDPQTGAPLMQKVFMVIEDVSGREKKLTFLADKEKGVKGAASPSFVQSLFNRELLRTFGVTEKKDLPKDLPAYKIYGEGKSTAEGRYPVIRIMYESSIPERHTAKVKEALEHTQSDFTARPAPDRLENFDSTLANETRYRAMWAILASWGAIMLYLWFRFGNWTFGLAAVICLIHDLFLTLGAIAACHFVDGTFLGRILGLDDFKIDLPSVAALLTLVGYSVNDTIVVFDRIREVRGKNPDLTAAMINDSINQTLSRTVLASLTTWLVVFVLYVWGGPGVHLFAFVMVIGVIVGTFSSIYIASPLLLMFGEGVHETPAHERRQQTTGASV